MKRQPSESDKIIVKETVDKELISKIYIQATQYLKANNSQPNHKVGKRSKHIFLQRHTSKKKHMKRCSTLLVIRKMQIRSTMRNHLMLVRMTIIKKSKNNKHWRGCGEKGTLLHCWWECKLIQPLWKMVWRFL